MLAYPLLPLGFALQIGYAGTIQTAGKEADGEDSRVFAKCRLTLLFLLDTVEGATMNINVTGRKMSIKDALRDYAEEKIGGAMKVMNIDPLDAEVVLHVEQNRSNPRRACCEVTIRSRGHIIRVEERDEDMYAAIDIAAAKVERQLRKFKTRVIDHHIQEIQESAAKAKTGDELDLDALMADLAKEDEEIVRVKEVEFPPMTEQQALIQIDLLGHDFFAYTDRDTNLVNVLYRRNNGGYGLLKQKD